MPTPFVLLTREEFGVREDRRRSKGLSLLDAFGAGVAYEMHWIHDPKKDADLARIPARLAQAETGGGLLSVFYLLTWAAIRSPITVICPNGHPWCIDSRSMQGAGWTVGGNPPTDIMPSIIVPGYHGLVVNGAFTDDLEGRGPTGIIAPPITISPTKATGDGED